MTCLRQEGARSYNPNKVSGTCTLRLPVTRSVAPLGNSDGRNGTGELAKVTSCSLQPSLCFPEIPSFPGRAKGSHFRESSWCLGCCHDDGVSGLPRGGGFMATGMQSLLLLVFWSLAAVAWPGSESDGGWQRHGAGTPAAVAEEERCTVERRADLSYAEFVQQYVRRPILATPLTPENPSRSSRSSVNLNRCCHALVCPAGHMCPELPRPPPCHQE